MDFPVEATVHLFFFQDETEVREILRSHGFVMTDLRRKQVRVKGSFLKLKAAKARLEQLLDSQTQTKTTPYSSLPVQAVSSGAIPKHYTNNSSASDGNRSRLGSRVELLCPSPSSPSTSASWMSSTSHNRPTSPEYRLSLSPGAEHCPSSRQGSESFVIDTDVYRFAERLRKKDIGIILDNHNVKMVVREFDDSSNITLVGKSAGKAATKLQGLLNELSKELRTQEVPRKDMDNEGNALLLRIQKNNNIYNSVLVCVMNDKLHLIGSSRESYELKQKLLGRPVDQSRRTGRTSERNSRGRSSSLPPINRKKTERDSGAVAYPSPVGAAGYSPSKYQDDKQEGAEPEWGAGARLGQGGAVRRRSHSESRNKKQAEMANGLMHNVDNVENKPKSPKSKKTLKQLLTVSSADIKQKFKDLRK